ncbi:hypothetical protein PIROE2DRAFT_14493 [Piromyces sp. E2]|nr:hypothetical protein PIROE2DRAFT_14493 [Piromyces sp. E2]|eukprot:OUM59862.1 hypothetical protein PIROE2DRAFT_14493 [Piromyces sp. E2]
MNTKNMMIYIFIYIFLYIQFIYNLDLTINSTDIPGYLISKYDEDKIISKKRLRAFHGWNYYCRNDNCFSLENGNGHPPLIEFPDENENIKKYIFETCVYINPETFWYYTYTHTYKETFYYLKCYNDSNCFYNNCIDNTCVYNDESLVTHYYQKSCNKNIECSSNACIEDELKICKSSVNEPSDSDVVDNKLEKIEK